MKPNARNAVEQLRACFPAAAVKPADDGSRGALVTVGLADPGAQVEWLRHHPLDRYIAHIKTGSEPDCPQCRRHLAAGPLPTRQPSR